MLLGSIINTATQLFEDCNFELNINLRVALYLL